MLQRLQLVGQLVGAEVELLVEGVDLALAVDAVAGPLALRAAPPDPPVGAVAGLLPAGRLNQAEPQLGQMCSAVAGFVWL